MKLSTTSATLLAQLGTVSRVASTRSAVQALSGVQLEAQDGRAELRATDMEVGLRVPLEAEIEREGVAVLPAHQRPSRLRPRRVRGCSQPVRASAQRPVTTGRLATLCTCVRTGAVRAFPAACGPMSRCAHVHSPYDFKPFQMRSEVTS